MGRKPSLVAVSTPRTILRLVFLVSGCLLAAASGEAQDGVAEEFSPVAIVQIPPLPEQFTAEVLGPPLHVEPPEHRPFDPRTWHLLKQRATRDPVASAPDVVIPPPGAREGGPAPLFPGIAYGGISPPDPTIGKSSTRIIQAVNSAVSLYNTSGTAIQSKTLANFLGAPSEPFPPFDPKVLYDRNAVNQRYYVLATFRDHVAPYDAALYLAVSRSPNPPDLNAASWCRYWIPATNDFGTNILTFADHPNMGAGADTLVITSSQYPITGGNFTYVVIQAFDKIGLANNAVGCPTAIAEIFRPAATPGDLSIFELQPALHYNSPSSFTGTTNPAYMVNTILPGSNTYRVWRVRNIRSGASPGNLQRVDVVAGSYSMPPDAPQKDTAILLDTVDVRTWQAGGVGDTVWATHSTVCNAGGGATESCARVVRFQVGQDGLGNPTAALTQSIVFGGGTDVFYWMPGIAVNQSNRTIVPFLHSSAGTYLSSSYTTKNSAASAYDAPLSIGMGSCARTAPLRFPPGGPGQAVCGDYMGAQTDPGNFTSFWVSGEYAAVHPTGATCTWRTQVISAN